MNQIFFYISLFYLYIFKCQISLNFKKKYFLPDIPYNLIENLRYNYLSVNLYIGSNQEKFSFNLIFEEYSTFLLGSEFNNSEIKIFNEKKSNSYKCFDLDYFYSFYSLAYKSKDLFQFKNIYIEDFYFLLVKEQNKDFILYNLSTSGVIGLHIYPRSYSKGLEEYNFVKQLKSNNYIDTETFYIKYNENNDEEGEIIFGYENYKYLVKTNYILQYKAQEQIKNLEWSINFLNCYSNYIKINNINNVRFVLESGMIIAPYEYQLNIDSFFFDDLLKQKHCELIELNSYSYYVCNNNINIDIFPILIFELKELNFTFNGKDLFKLINDKYYFLICFKYSINWWVLGKPFFKKYQVIFDMENQIIGFNIGKLFQKDYSFIVLIIVICIIIIIITIYILKNKVYNKFNKMTEYELIQNYKNDK